MSQLKTNSITHVDNTGDPNITLHTDGSTSIRNYKAKSINGGPISGFRNQVMNPTGAIQQRPSGANNSGDYGVDRWRMFTTDGGTAGAMSRQNTSPNGVIAGVPPEYIAIGRNPGNTATGFVLIQGIEEWTRFMGKTYTLSWLDASDAGFNDFVQVLFSSNGTSAGAGNEFGDVGASAANYVNEGTVEGWTQYSVTLNIPTLSEADYNTMAGSSNACLLVKFGSNTGIAESNYGRYTAIQLEPGPLRTPLELRFAATELAMCQRYYQVVRAGIRNDYASGQAAAFGGPFNFFQPMRITPPFVTKVAEEARQNVTQEAVVNVSANGAMMEAVGIATDGGQVAQQWVADFGFDAEL